MPTLLIVAAEPWASLLERFAALGRAYGQAALNVLAALLVMLVGWALAALLARLANALLRLFRLENILRRVLRPRTVTPRDPAGIVAWAVYWLVLSGAAMLALEVLGFSLAASVADRLAEVVPRIVTSAFLFAVGALIALVLGGITRRFLVSADVRAARFTGQVVSALLTGIAALLALDQLGFAAQFVMAVGITAVASAGLGLALAFGLGCRDLARDFLVEYLRSLEDAGPQRPA
jgi:hypothetical protein